MKIQVHFFAQIKEAFGQSARILDVPEGATVSGTVRALMDERVAEAIRDLPLSYAVNDIYTPADFKLSEGDQLFILPPVAGG